MRWHLDQGIDELLTGNRVLVPYCSLTVLDRDLPPDMPWSPWGSGMVLVLAVVSGRGSRICTLTYPDLSRWWSAMYQRFTFVDI